MTGATLARRAVPAATVVLLAGCGGAGRGPAQELPKPVYAWSWTAGVCGGEKALDGEGVLWSEEGCDTNGTRLSPRGRATAAERAAVVDAFSSLPEPSAEGCPVPAHRFQIDAGGRVRTWAVCGDVPAGALPDPYAAVARALRREARP